MRANLVGSSVVSAITQTPASGPDAPTTVPPMSVAPTVTACWAYTVVGMTFGSTVKPANIVNRASALVTNMVYLPAWNRFSGRLAVVGTLTKRSAASNGMNEPLNSRPRTALADARGSSDVRFDPARTRGIDVGFWG